jgi:hypothetical protein
MNDTLLDQEKEIKSYKDLLVGPNAKFKDDEELAKGKWFADATITVQNKQMDEMRELILKQREEIDARESLEELLGQLKQQDTNSKNTPAKEVSTKPMIDQTELDSLISSRLERHEKQKIEEANLAKVRSVLKEQYGEKTADVLKSKMNEFGLSEEDINSMAKKNPSLFFNSLGLNQQTRDNFQAPPRSSVRSDNFKPSAEDHTWSWYQKNYKKRDFIANKDLNVQMARDAAALGDAFYDGDFYNSYHKQN